MTISLIRPASNRGAPVKKSLVSRDCGPEGCELDWLTSTRIEAELGIEGFTRYSVEAGWGDGLPVIPPTEGRVRAFLAANHRYPDELIASLPPSNAECTIEKIVINAVMAGAPAASLELIVAAVEAIADPDFELYGINTTTAPVYPAFVVNGDVRGLLSVPQSFGCLGGEASEAVAIGRALRFIMRNVAGQIAGVTSQTTFGSPGRVAGIVVAENEENSPWAPLAERRGVAGNAVTAFATMGTMNILDTTSQHADEFLEMIGKSLAVPGANCFSPSMPYSEMVVAINPIWAKLFAEELSSIVDVQERLWKYASIPADWLQALHREQLEGQGRVRADGRVYVTPEPKDMILFVAGGIGGLHATAFHSFGSPISQTRAIAELGHAKEVIAA
jgi:hypothetical protein